MAIQDGATIRVELVEGDLEVEFENSAEPETTGA